MSDVNDQENQPVGSHINVILLGINDNKEIQGKIDTGASQTSLGVKNLQVTDNAGGGKTVSFEFNDKQYKMNAAGEQEIKTADNGTDKRPVINISVKHNENTVPNIDVNLNNRDGMDDQLLIGMDLIEKLNLTIKPHQSKSEESEEVTVNTTDTTNVDDTPTSTQDHSSDLPINVVKPVGDAPLDVDPIQQILDIVNKHPEITIKQLLSRIKTEAYSNIDKLQY
jgi:hypothetical protein